MTIQNNENIINFYGVLFGEDGKAFANKNIDIVKNNVIKYFSEMERTMPENELLIIKKFYGIGCGAMTIDEISKELNISKEKVLELKGQGVRMLKHPSRSRIGYPILANINS